MSEGQKDRMLSLGLIEWADSPAPQEIHEDYTNKLRTRLPELVAAGSRKHHRQDAKGLRMSQQARAIALIAEIMIEQRQGWLYRVRAWWARQLQSVSIPEPQINTISDYQQQVIALTLRAERALKVGIDHVEIGWQPSGREVKISGHEANRTKPTV